MENQLLKVSSAGNRFLIADKHWFENKIPSEWQGHSYKTKNSFKSFLELSTLTLEQRNEFIKNLISEKELSLTDGLVVIKKSESFAFSCDFYNKDGSKAEMCGNAACCLSAYVEWMSFPIKKFQFEKEIISCRPGGGIVLEKTPVPISNYSYKFSGTTVPFTLIQPSEVPHGVLKCPLGEWSFEDKTKLKKLAQKLRFENPKNDKGMNVSFFQVEKLDRLKAITFERGVEDFTLACGTGALAVAFVYLHSLPQNENLKEVFVNMPGGELKIQFESPPVLFSPAKKGF